MIEIRGLQKRFGPVEALRGLDLHVSAGEVYGLVGPNGAGKTTAMSILATLLPADQGIVKVNNIDVAQHPQQVRRLIGYMPDFFGVYDGLTATEYLSFFATAYRIPVNKQHNLITDLLELVNLKEKSDTYVDTMSRGMKQRLALARCLIHDPKVLILDEPASGLDPRARVEIKEILRQLKLMDKTILISSHILPELAEMCDQVGFLERGYLVASGPVAEITSGYKETKIIHIALMERVEELVTYLAGISSVSQVEVAGNNIKFFFKGDNNCQWQLLKDIILQGYGVLQFSEQNNTLEDVFMAVTRKEELHV